MHPSNHVYIIFIVLTIGMRYYILRYSIFVVYMENGPDLLQTFQDTDCMH